MANTLTGLIPDAYAALDVVSRELVGFIPAVTRDAQADRVALGQNLRVPATVANTAGKNISPAMSFPAQADQTITNKVLTITKTRAYPFSWSGEDQNSLNSPASPNDGYKYLSARQDQIAQALRGLVNEMEVDLATAMYQGASRAYGTAGTIPFTTSLAESAQMKKILDDNGAPMTGRTLVINTTAGAALRTLINNPLNANPSLSNDLTRQGVILGANGFDFREAAQVQSPTAGTGTSYTTTAAGFAVGTTSLPLITGSGTILAGDVVTFAGDTNKYVVTAGIAAPGTIVIAAPGLLVAMSAATKAVTVIAGGARNVALSRNAGLLATRLPALPEEGDLAILREVITDPLSGISFEFSVWPGYRMAHFEVAACWGVLSVKPEHSAVLIN